MPRWGEMLDVPFGGVERVMSQLEVDHPLANKMRKLYGSIVHDPRQDNRNVRKRNAKSLELMLKVRDFSPHAYNIAELYYNGAPGIPKDWNNTLEWYVISMEAPDAAALKEAFAHRTFFSNLLGVLDAMEVDGIAPVAMRLQAACELPCWREIPAARLAALYGRARLAYLQSRRPEASELWRQCVKMWTQFDDAPLIQNFCIEARHQIAKMQNTQDSMGDQSKIDAGMVAIDAERAQAKAALRPLIEKLPYYASLDQSENSSHKEDDRIVIDAKIRAREGESADDAMARITNELQRVGCDMEVQVALDTAKQCAACGRKPLLGEKTDRGSMQEGIWLSACVCGQVYYCSGGCQKSHWKVHRTSCNSKRGAGAK